ncbi:MAG: hypothetical protein D6786_01670 [Gammaproteobacteria bacterium]|nr:MAG: hypothetical protein D6786_01670 [Gammaproteobacteria bacterium]
MGPGRCLAAPLLPDAQPSRRTAPFRKGAPVCGARYRNHGFALHALVQPGLFRATRLLPRGTHSSSRIGPIDPQGQWPSGTRTGHQRQEQPQALAPQALSARSQPASPVRARTAGSPRRRRKGLARDAARPAGGGMLRLPARTAHHLRPDPRSVIASLLLTILVLSLPPKTAGLHISGALVMLWALLQPRDVLSSRTIRAYFLLTSAWLVPVILAAIVQHAVGLETATEARPLLTALFRMLGIGVGLLILLERGWIPVRIAHAIFVGALLVNVVAGYVQWLGDGSLHDLQWRAYRMQGLAGNPNPFGTFTSLLLTLLADRLRQNHRNPLYWTMALLAAGAIWLSGSRGALLVSAAGLLVLFSRHLSRRNVVAFLMIGIPIGITLSFVASHFQEASTSHRLVLIDFSWNKILESPLIGWGAHAFATFPAEARNGIDAPHNMLLDLALTGGLLPVIGWILSTGYLAYRLFMAGTAAATLMLALLASATLAGLLEYSLVNSLHFQITWMLVTVFGCRIVWQETAHPRHLEVSRSAPHIEAMPDGAARKG